MPGDRYPDIGFAIGAGFALVELSMCLRSITQGYESFAVWVRP